MQQQNQNKAFILAYFNALSGHPKPKDLLDKYMSDEALVAHISFFETAFPNYEILSEELMAEGGSVIAKARFKGKHIGQMGEIPPTNKEVNIPFVIRYEIDNKKIISHWILADQMGMMQQLGVIPVAEATH